MRLYLLILFLFFSSGFCKADLLSFDIPSKKVILKSKTNEPSFVIYGYNTSKNFVVVKIKGPNQKVILQKKTKFLSMWTWKKSGEFSYPSVFHYYTNNKKLDIDFRIKKNLHDNIILLGKDRDNLKKDLIKKKMNTGFFLIKNNAFNEIEKENPVFFKIPVYLPYNSPAGKYEIMMEVFNAGKVVQKKKKYLTVVKPGFNSFIYSFAHNFSFLYGLLCAIVAIALGLTAGYVFRR